VQIQRGEHLDPRGDAAARALLVAVHEFLADLGRGHAVQAPVAPVAIRGSWAVLPVGRLLPRHAAVTVTVAPPLTPPEDGWRGAVALQREARRLLLRHSHEPDLA